MLALVDVALLGFALSSPALPAWRTHVLRSAVTASEDMPPSAPIDKQLSDPNLITFSSISDEFKPLCRVALQRLDKFRALSGKPKYETIDGMIDAYVQEAADAGLNWTREEAESEVVRYLQRQALADEGGIDGDGQDKAAFALLAGLIGLLSALFAQNTGLIDTPQSFQLPPM